MAHVSLGAVLRHLRRFLDGPGDGAPSDAALLERFAGRRDPAAFEALLRRHGPMVLAVCRGVLGDAHDAEDAFQAAFLVLAGRAAAVRKRASVGSWLHGVAYRVALKARGQAARRRACEREAGAMRPRESADDPTSPELRSLLHEELARLPERFRAPVVLCYLEGHSNEEAARLLRCPVGTVKSRLNLARERLRRRLVRRGVALSAGAAAACLAENLAPAALPPSLVQAALTHAIQYAAGAAAGTVSARLTGLAREVSRDLAVARLKGTLAVLLAFTALGLGLGVYAHTAASAAPDLAPDARPAPADVLRPAGGERVEPGDVGPRFAVPPGFRAEVAAHRPGARPTFSLLNLTFDARGRLLVSEEGGPVLLCSKPDPAGVCEDVRPYCEQVTRSQGMCWVGDALLLVGHGPQGPGLYRCRDTKGNDRVDEVTLLLAFHGEMSEHGPHAVIHGPDGCLYVVVGNRAGPKVGRLADRSPLRRWPDGRTGPEQGQSGSTEDVLLPRLNDARGRGADVRAPGGTVWRLDPDGTHPALVAAGLHNAFDAAFNSAGELFTFDGDEEGDLGLPWYRPVRVLHLPPGADFVGRTGSANTPDYYLDSLPSALDTGRGSPVGMEFYEHTAFPAKYRGCCFMADWSVGLIHAVRFRRDGAGYRAESERFCSGAPLNVTDVAVGPDGALYFTAGGRGTQGGVYRVVYGGEDVAPAAPARDPLQALIDQPQPLSAWGRAAAARQRENFPGGTGGSADEVRAGDDEAGGTAHPRTQPVAPAPPGCEPGRPDRPYPRPRPGRAGPRRLPARRPRHA